MTIVYRHGGSIPPGLRAGRPPGAAVIAELRYCSGGDERALLFLEWWERMHRGRRPLVTAALRSFTRPGPDGGLRRYLWEVCRWPQHDGDRWHFICWMIDDLGAWWLPFRSHRAALAYYRRPVAIIMSAYERSLPFS